MTGMRRLAFLVVVTAVAAGTMAAREGKRRRGKQPQESLLDQLVRECKLTDKQQADVKAKAKTRDEALAKWDKANAEKVEAAEAAAKEARSKDDANAKKTASAALRELRTAREESGAEATAAVMKVLTPKQKSAWDAYLLYKTISGRYRRAQLTEEQLAKVKAACAFAAKQIAEIGDDSSKPEKAKRDITNKLRWAIDALILTPEQRETTARKPAGKGKKDNK